MMGSDARDMMGLPSAAPPKPTPKAPKPKVKGPSGMAREVLDLNFEGAPPISIVAPKFKEKPKFPFKPRRWDWTPFSNSARKDGLILNHWRREGEAPAIPTGLPVTPADSNAASEMDTDDKSTSGMQDSMAAKWNVKIERPKYSDEEYDTHLKSDDWSKEETGYLVDLAIDLDLRWVVIGDRFEYRPSEPPKDQSSDLMDVDKPSVRAKTRTTEDLKARYYTVAAKTMTLRTPMSSMNPTEFDTHEKMTKYDPRRETVRKQYAEKLLLRTQEETNEEERLLKELQRIVTEQEKLLEDRKALYDRLEAPRAINPAAANASTAMYQSSQALHSLMQNMMYTQRQKASEQREKRRSALGIDTENANNQAMIDGRGHRGSLGSASAIHEKRQSHPTPQHRPLTHTERAKFGVSYPQERLTSGVQFRHERVMKASQAKSAVQTSRISDALAELGIPPRLVMPTAKVVAEYERMVESVKTLVDVRKMREKVDGEIRVYQAQKNMANGDGPIDQVNGEETKAEDDEAAAEEEDDQAEAKEEENADSDDEMDDTKLENDEDDDEQTVIHGTVASQSYEGDGQDEDGENNDVEANVEDQEDDEEAEGEDEEEEEQAGEEEEEDDEDDEEDAEGSDASQEVEQEVEPEDVEAENEDDNASPDAEEDDASGVEDEDEDEDEDEEAEAEVPDDDGASTRARSIRKRSASVISALSNKSTKRQRK